MQRFTTLPIAEDSLPVDCMDVDELIQFSRPKPRPAQSDYDDGAPYPNEMLLSSPTLQEGAPRTLCPDQPFWFLPGLSPDLLALYPMVA